MVRTAVSFRSKPQKLQRHCKQSKKAEKCLSPWGSTIYWQSKRHIIYVTNALPIVPLAKFLCGGIAYIVFLIANPCHKVNLLAHFYNSLYIFNHIGASRFIGGLTAYFSSISFLCSSMLYTDLKKNKIQLTLKRKKRKINYIKSSLTPAIAGICSLFISSAVNIFR